MKIHHIMKKFLTFSTFCAAALTLFVSPACASPDDTGDIAGGSAIPESSPTLWIVGDSTAAEFDDTTYYYPRYGWGTQLGRYFQGISIENLAVSGTSTQSFLQTAQYQRLLEEMNPGDYLLIGFGHNRIPPLHQSQHFDLHSRLDSELSV